MFKRVDGCSYTGWGLMERDEVLTVVSFFFFFFLDDEKNNLFLFYRLF